MVTILKKRLDYAQTTESGYSSVRDKWFAVRSVSGFLSNVVSILFLLALERGEIQGITGTFELAGFCEDPFTNQVL